MGVPALRVVSNTLPDPPYPATTRAKGWRFELDYERIEASDTWALAPAELRPWLLMLWMQAWRQTPCGSMPDNDALIAARLGMSVTMFQTHRETLMRGWTLCSDGLLYHPVIVEKALSMLAMKQGEAKRKADYRARHSNPLNVPRLSHGTPADGQNVPRDGATGTGTGTEDLTPSAIAEGESAADASDVCPECPHQKIVDAWHAVLPSMQGVATWTGQRQINLRVRWRERWKAGKYKTEDEGIAYWSRVFAAVGKSSFLTGTNERGWTATLPWLVNASNFAKFLDGYYVDNKGTKK